jgi:hypothetical protein
MPPTGGVLTCPADGGTGYPGIGAGWYCCGAGAAATGSATGAADAASTTEERASVLTRPMSRRAWKIA